MLDRRSLFRLAAQAGLFTSLSPLTRRLLAADPTGVLLNDVQSQLNETRVQSVVKPQSLDDIAETILTAKRSGRAISVAGGRHSMGKQQFGTDNVHLDMTTLNHVVKLDREHGLVTVEAGIQWPDLIEELHKLQPDASEPWTIRQKQTGVDAVTIGGSLSSNVHGRGLKFPPIVDDVESFDLMDAAGHLQTCSRNQNAELFSLAIGGYGLFGIIVHVTLRLVRRFKVRRRVEVIKVKDLPDRHAQRIAQGFVFGDCQYGVDLGGSAEDHEGVMAYYEPVDMAIPITDSPTKFSRADWARLYRLIRTDKRRAFEEYAKHYLKTDRQVYWSDTHQLAGEFVGHREAVDATEGTEMITEGYVRFDNLLPMLSKVRQDLSEHQVDITYGTIRFIEPDRETFLPWAKEKSVCIVCNLHVRHTEDGIRKATADIRRMLDHVISFEGSFYLTYHRWATPKQILACYPRIREFFELKKKYDPREVFQSDWYRFYQPEFS